VGEATNSVVTADDISAYQANDLADIFRLVPSISVGGSVGVAQKIYLRGLEDSLINVTVDGAPQTSTLFHHIGRVTIDPDLLKQVEVQEGAGEATSGAGAIGGAIRFQTKDVDDLLDTGESFGGHIKANAFTNDGSQYGVAVYGRFAENWGVIASLTDVDRKTIESGDGAQVLGTAAEQEMAFVKLSGNIDDSQRLSISFETRDESGQFSQRPNWIVQPDDTLYESEAQRETVVVNYSLAQSDILNIEATIYDTSSSYRGGRFDWLADIATMGFDLRNRSELGKHQVTYGIDYRDDEVTSGYFVPQPEENHAESGSVLGLYIQSHSQLSDALLLSYGLRFDDYDYEQKILLPDYYGDPIPDTPVQLSDSQISVNAGFSYALNDAWTFGLGYAQAARGKEIGDGFTLDSYLWDGSTDPVVDPDLSIETVSNLEASLEYSAGNVRAKIAVYQSAIDDVIFERLYGDSFYENIGTIETSGFEFDIAYRWDNVDLYIGFAANDAGLVAREGLYANNYGTVDLNGYEFNGLGSSRGDTWNIGVDYRTNDTLRLGVNLTQVNSLSIDTLHQDFEFGWVPALHELEKPSYAIVDVYARWLVTENVDINLAITNLLDEEYRDHSSVGDFGGVPGYETVVGPSEAGQDIRLSAAFRF
ncbi:MAG: TonB-dependent receptor, partial [Pseudomonadota bacterium]